MMNVISRRHFTDAAMTRDVEVTLPMRLSSPLNGSQGVTRGAMFADAKRRKTQREMGRWCLMGVLMAEGVKLPVDVTITRIAPRKLDDDNLAASAKNLRDGIADALGCKDHDPRVSWRYEQAKGLPKQYAVRITIAQRKPCPYSTPDCIGGANHMAVCVTKTLATDREHGIRVERGRKP